MLNSLVKCILDSMNECIERKLIKIGKNRYAITSRCIKGKTYIIALYISGLEIPLTIETRKCVKIGASQGFTLTSTVLATLETFLRARKLKICYSPLEPLANNKDISNQVYP